MFTGQLATVSSRFANIIPGYLGVMTAIAIAPASANIVPSSTLQLAANATDQLGYVLEVQPAFTWTRVSGNSTIDSSTGVATGEANPGTTVFRATSGSIHGDGTLNVRTGPSPSGAGIPSGSQELKQLNSNGAFVAASQSVGQTQYEFQNNQAGVSVAADATGGAAFEGASDPANANAFFRLDANGNFIPAAQSLGSQH